MKPTPLIETMPGVSRRRWLMLSSLLAMGATLPRLQAAENAPTRRKMRMALTPGSIGVRANQIEAIQLAAKHGFEAVEPYASYLAGLSDEALKTLREDMAARQLAWAAAGFPLQFRGDDAAYQASLKELPKTAAALQRAGVERMGTWLSPTHATLNREENWSRHVTRLREGARILRDHGLRLGLEYVGTRSARAGNRQVFLYNLRDTLALIRDIGEPNVGVILDSWHWWQAGETAADLLKLKNSDVVSVDLNDAPAGLAIEQQQDGRRELPMATGVIPVRDFLNSLQNIGYDGPVRAEPFNQALNDLDNDAACAAVAAAMKKAFALLD
ncbi:sugar phosphate isomerase/epimerase [Fontisphaera persica]|uniref:sugar phosphate isomerase/epimerase family protein n=1 Tax=Fontisphaera persica TaxID=2974023 RepID=UPI0024BF3E57|nr:sugar phosphate isomerase/epimerase family protein [Fontisphaera persica]WCJ59900.1 sugar phosphate isomerase/epimerase [Fontisphaera persica]